jgi:CobQ-like glutamine amidotransferase family enzyme
MGHHVSLVDIDGVSDAAIDPDVVCVGSGSTSSLRPALTALVPLASALHDWADAGVTFFALGMGWDVLGESVTTVQGETLPGVGLFPSSCDYQAGRYSGEVAGVDFQGRDTAGYINQVGVTTRHSGEALMTIDHSAGAIAHQEGLRHGSLLGTKLGGPALSLNPHWRDDVIDAVVTRRGLGPTPQSREPECLEFLRRTHQLATQARQAITARVT